MTSVNNRSNDRSLNLLTENKLAVWDFLESQRHLIQIAQDRKIHVLVSYLSILSTQAWLTTKCPLKSHHCAENESWCVSQFKMKKCLRCELEQEAMRIAKELDSLKQIQIQGGDNRRSLENEMNWETERRFCSEGKVFFYH